ncbi:MAG: SpoIIE family protein phosphatase [Phycisphaerae bacterium]
MIEVTIHHPDGRVATQLVSKNSFFVGREASCDVALDDHVISRRHSRVSVDVDGNIWVEDLKSKNGTFLNEREVGETPMRVAPTDRVGVGKFSLALKPADTSGTVVLGEIETQFGSTSVWRPDQLISLPQQRLDRLYSLFERLTGLFDRNELLNEVITVAMETMRFDRAGIALWKGEPSQPEWVAIRAPRRDPSGEFRISRSIVSRALHCGERILVNDVSSDVGDPTVSMISNNIRSAVCVPLVYHDKVHGVLYGDRITASTGYTREDVDFFAALAKQAAMALVNADLLSEQQQRQRMQQQLEIARTIQQRLLPSQPLVRPDVTVEALNDPGQSVSGDYFDYFVRPDGGVVVIVADVAGKGVPAALLMANLQAAVQVSMTRGGDLVEAATALNRLVCANVQSDRFITAIIGVVEPAARTFRFVNAGHLWPIVTSARGDLRVIESEPNLPLGVELDERFALHQAQLYPGRGTLLLYTDGVTEAQNASGGAFEMPRLIDAARSVLGEPPREQIAVIRRLIRQFTRDHPQSDDITLLAMQLS